MDPLVVRVEDVERRTAAEYAFARSPVRIGRSAGNDLCLPQRFVSSWHGVIEFDDSSASYTDLGSTNGTLLDGAPLEPRAAAPLSARSEVAIGALRFTFPAWTPARADPPARQPSVPPGGITEMMRRLAAAPSVDFERAWRQVLVPGAVIGRFELVKEIGRGGFGIVFEAKDRQLGRLVAFKAVRPGRESLVTLRQEILQREAEAAAQLNHPNIVSLYDVGTCESGPYLILELLRGETLRERMKRARLPLRDALEIGIQVAWALDHAHALGVVHRDLKPANVFLAADSRVKVLDFGLAHVFGAGDTKAIGTPAYMSPEQWRQAKQDARTDVFGAAAMLAETVTGRLPYRVTEESSEVLEPSARPRVEDPASPPQLCALLRRALSPDPARRPSDGHAWLAALLRIHEALDRAPPAELTGTAEAGAKGRLRLRWPKGAIALAAAALLAAVGALAYLALR